MKCNQKKHEQDMDLDNLDRALHDLGMLSAVTEARRDYLRESKSDLCVMRLDTRFVSNVTVGYCMKRASHKNRLSPYVLPVRHRTKSENSDPVESESQAGSCKENIRFEPSSSGVCKEKGAYVTKRCLSLENLSFLGVETPRSDTLHELDSVSTQIEKLQVAES